MLSLLSRPTDLNLVESSVEPEAQRFPKMSPFLLMTSSIDPVFHFYFLPVGLVPAFAFLFSGFFFRLTDVNIICYHEKWR